MKGNWFSIEKALEKNKQGIQHIRDSWYRRVILESDLFDINYYNEQYGKNFSEAEGLEHYLSFGWKEHKNPSAIFSTQSYLDQYLDVAEAGVCPLLHYVMYGKREHRKAFRDESAFLLDEGLYKKEQYVFPIHCVGSYAELETLRGEDGLFCVGASDSTAKEFLLTHTDVFYDESVMALVCLNGQELPEGLYSANTLVSRLSNPDTFTVKRGNCLFRSCVDTLKQHPEIWNSDYSFTNYFLESVSAGKIRVYQCTSATCEEVALVPLEERIHRFHSITQNFCLEPNAIAEYFHMICASAKPNEDQQFQRDLLQRMNHVNNRIMVSLYSFSNGGGEMQPIRLANELKKEGVPVVVHVFSPEDSTSAIRHCLRFDIPVIYTQNGETLSREIDSLAIDCVNTHHCSCQVLVSTVNSPRINHVATSHGMFDSMNLENVRYLFENALKDKVDYWTYVADKNLVPFRTANVYEKARFSKIPNGIEVKDCITPVNLERIGVPKDSFVICLASRAIAEKGWLEAIEAVKKARKKTSADIRLVLVGDGPVYDQIREKHPEYVYPVGLQSNVLSWFAAADVCILPTYYACESFPLTIVEALQCGKPIIATDIGEIRKMLSDGVHNAGELLTLKNGSISVDELAGKIIFLANDASAREFYASVAKRIRGNFDIRKVAEQYLDVYNAKQSCHFRNYHAAMARMKLVYMSKYYPHLCPKVSVIVPNYNYARFLNRRLDCIYGQTYKNYEVILLDDCSTDNSRELLEQYRREHPDNTMTAFNIENQGVFGQWKKGMSLATGELCWIAEADDWCEDTFLECLVPLMLEPDVRIAYGKYVYARDEEEKNYKGYENYTAALDSRKWKQSYIEDADIEVHGALGRRNTLVNVSGLIFARPKDIDTVCSPEWIRMKICGDWLFYLTLLKNGRIAYCKDVHSYFRISSDQSSAGTGTYVRDSYYREHAQVMAFLKRNYQFNKEELSVFRGFVQNHCDALDIPQNRRDELMRYLDIGSISEADIRDIPRIDFRELPCFIVESAMESDSEDETAFLRSGSNTGNLVFVDAAKKQFKSIQTIDIASTNESEYYGRCIVCLSNMITFESQENVILNNLLGCINNIGGQITIFGLGSQSAFPDQSPGELVETLDFKKISVLKKLAAKSHTLGIRGQYTADCLEVMGIHNYQVIGCPSIYLQESYEHMRGKKPSLDRLLVTFTRNVANSPYEPWEFALMQIGAKYHAAWCKQTLNEYPGDLIQRGELDPQIADWVNSSCSIFYNCEKWSSWLRENGFTMCVGSRFHGNMMAFQNGIPTLWVDHDSRTAELLEFLHLPHVDRSQITDADCLEGLLDACNYDDFLEHYPELRRRYIRFLKENGIMLKDW